MNQRQIAVIKKDIRSIISNKRLFSIFLVVPIVFTVVIPSIFVFVTLLVPNSTSDFQKILDMLPVTFKNGDEKRIILEFVFNKIMPVFFMIIPIMASSVMSAGLFVGEKEKRTLETLLFSPLSLKQLFQAKVFASLLTGMAISFISFSAMTAVFEAELLIMTGSAVIPEISWLIVMLLVSPSVSLLAVGITVRMSAKAQTFEEAQQYSGFLVLPIIALIVGQFTGVIMISPLILLCVGIVFALLAWLTIKNSFNNFTYEKLLK